MWINCTKDEANFKRDVRDRIVKARADKIPTGKLVSACGGNVTFGHVYDVIGGQIIGFEIYKRLDKGLKKLGY